MYFTIRPAGGVEQKRSAPLLHFAVRRSPDASSSTLRLGKERVCCSTPPVGGKLAIFSSNTKRRAMKGTPASFSTTLREKRRHRRRTKGNVLKKGTGVQAWATPGDRENRQPTPSRLGASTSEALRPPPVPVTQKGYPNTSNKITWEKRISRYPRRKVARLTLNTLQQGQRGVTASQLMQDRKRRFPRKEKTLVKLFAVKRQPHKGNSRPHLDEKTQQREMIVSRETYTLTKGSRRNHEEITAEGT